ncbi:hypothetical protein LXL04_039040 [Taraxacum kok-saghyz]
MMLVQSSIDSLRLSSVPDLGKQEMLCVWIPGNQSWQEHPNATPVTKDETSSSRNFLSSSQLSTEGDMPETSKPNLVYKRKKTGERSKPTIVYKRKKVQNVCCSSSKSYMELGSVSLKQQQVDDVGECSSSVVVKKDVSETNSCMVFLGNHLVLERRTFNKPTDFENDICSLRACKICEQSSLTLKMLICDTCEEWFHMYCCNPVVKKIPVGDWFCRDCLRKKFKKMKEASSEKSPKGYFGLIVAMLRDVDSYKSDVRIGEDFQAEVPDWSGPFPDQLNNYSEPEPSDLNHANCATYQEWDSSKLSRLGSIGNWVQCRQIVDRQNGRIVCGKWRRAPLFEVQSDDWECFSSVHWDPTHADCAVPQEICTDQVLKQLKYIEMLRPRLSPKRWKLGVCKGVDGEEHIRNTQKS